MLREMRRKGPGEYGAASPTFTLMKRKLLPEYKKVFRQLGRFTMSPTPMFEFHREGLLRVFGRDDEPCSIFFCNGSNPDTLESMTLKALHSDECGQRAFAAGSFEAIDRRLAIHGGRHLMTTTPYEWNYLKSNIYDRWMAGDTGITVVNFESIMNPVFPKEKWERAKAKLPPWRFDMMYRGRFTRPAGQIYDCFEREKNTCPRFLIPRNWKRVQGVDFGNVNTASNWGAIDPKTDKIYIYRSYHAGGEDAEGHLANWNQFEHMMFELESELRHEPLSEPICYGGAPSEDDWRNQYAQAGLSINRPPISNVEAGIQLVYGLLKSGQLVIFDDLDKLIQDIETYSRKVNEHGEPLLEIDEKATFHRLDALRYLAMIALALLSGEGTETVKRSVGQAPDRPKFNPLGIVVAAEVSDSDDSDLYGSKQTRRRVGNVRR